MANKHWQDTNPDPDTSTHKPVGQPKGKAGKVGANFKAHPHHTGPKVDGIGEVPKA